MSGVPWAPTLPDHWTRGSLRWLARIYAGGTPDRTNPEYWRKGSIPWLNSGSVNDWIITKPSELISEAGFAHSSARWVPPGSVVVGLAGQGRTKGTAARLEIASTTNQSMAAIVPGPSLDYRYLHYWLASNYQSLRNLSGGDKRDGLNLQHISAIGCPLPPRDEQRAIADYLDREIAQIDTLIAKQEQLIATLRERRIGTIRDAVTKGVNSHAPLTQSHVDWIGKLPEHWRCERLKWSISDAQPGVWGEEPHGDGTDVACVRVADFDRKVLRTRHPRTERWVRPQDLQTRLLEEGDLLLEKSGGTALNPVGFVAIFEGAPTAAVCSNFITRLRVKQGQFSRYWLYAHAASYSTHLTARSVNQTTGIQNLDQSMYFNEFFPFPPMEEQQLIADFLDKQCSRIDDVIAKAEKLIALAKERRSALITAAVTGQIDVSAAA